ncbi:unnamed protein product [Brugia timori]|uniref:F-box domain-containing protein n=1 Tax=Brugia timori TaxID=42155 RepID=A0A0R3QJC8_9BILA|nr:unnamed protein product [Brugia timori]
MLQSTKTFLIMQDRLFFRGTVSLQDASVISPALMDQVWMEILYSQKMLSLAQLSSLKIAKQFSVMYEINMFENLSRMQKRLEEMDMKNKQPKRVWR